MALSTATFGGATSGNVWNGRSLVATLLVHVGPAEALYYVCHRTCHRNEYVYRRYHQLHHASVTPEPSTVGSSTWVEQVGVAGLMWLALIGGRLLSGGLPIGTLYTYVLLFDWLRACGHCNVDVVPPSVYRSFPLLQYLLFTPSYHLLHHEHRDANFCLFVPLYDYLGNTMRPMALHKMKPREACSIAHLEYSEEHVPEFVFLLHGVELLHPWHVPFGFRAFTSHGYRPTCLLYLLWPFTIAMTSIYLFWGSAFKLWNYYIKEHFHQVWCIPRCGFMYFVPQQKDAINNLIEKAILHADRSGVKVLGLGALNKMEALNCGGLLFLKKHPNLKVRICHGDTLTVAIILKALPENVSEVFLTGSTSKIGRAIALYLCEKDVKVLMLTTLEERFQTIKMEASPTMRNNLVQVTSYYEGEGCKTWILGKSANYVEQSFAQAGTYFHQFVVPPVKKHRKDCTYGKLASIQLPIKDVKGLASCEVSGLNF
ncbi:hypothetical protein L7F22_027963 [Adiantum nelumboides]|nr:hypothetical protein [Adiantum nelumboides]